MTRDRAYRSFMKRPGLVSYRVRHMETDLFLQAERDISDKVSAWVIEARSAIEDYARSHPGFIESYQPLPDDPFAPLPVRDMLKAGRTAGVGPMASVAGAIAEFVCRRMAEHLNGEIIVENGGDTCFRLSGVSTVCIWAGDSPLSGRVGIRCSADSEFLSVCTSSGTVGHSKSFGTADAVTVISENAAIADAAATAVGNMVKSTRDIHRAVEALRHLNGILGGVIIKGDKLGAWGRLELVSI